MMKGVLENLMLAFHNHDNLQNRFLLLRIYPLYPHMPLPFWTDPVMIIPPASQLSSISRSGGSWACCCYGLIITRSF